MGEILDKVVENTVLCIGLYGFGILVGLSPMLALAAAKDTAPLASLTLNIGKKTLRLIKP